MVFSEQGKTPLYFSKGRRLLGIIAVGDSLIDNTAQAISELRNMGLKVFMLTGDNEYTGKAIAAKIGIDDVIPDVYPDRKGEILKTLSDLGRVALIGDDAYGNNIISMNKSIPDVVASIRLSRRILRTIKENIIFSLIFNIIGIITATGILKNMTGIMVGPIFCVFVLLISVTLVVLNSLRLKYFDVRDSSKDKTAIMEK